MQTQMQETMKRVEQSATSYKLVKAREGFSVLKTLSLLLPISPLESLDLRVRKQEKVGY